MSTTTQVDVLIVGAGMAGLTAARQLRDEGLSVCLLEKEDHAGGRLATSQVGPGLADYGAQFFTARTDDFRALVDAWLDESLVFQWSRGWSDGSLHRAPPSGHARYAVQGGMARLIDHLTSGLDVRTSTPVRTVDGTDYGWRLQSAGGDDFSSRALLLTAPVPQSLALLASARTLPPWPEQIELATISYAPNLTGLFWLDGPFYMPAPGAIQRINMPVQWIADNRRKGISDSACVLTVQLSAARSRALWHESDEMILEEMRRSFMLFMGPRGQLLEQDLKRWEYAMPETAYQSRYLIPELIPSLAFAGDAFGGPRVEGAVLSGRAAGRALARYLRATAAG